jgi:hypothetical protein
VAQGIPAFFGPFDSERGRFRIGAITDGRLIDVCRFAAIEYARLLIMSLRHGSVPKGRRMFDVSAEETTHLAEANDLQRILRLDAKSVQ